MLQALSRLKEVLCKAPVLRSPEFNRPFTLQTDASERAIEAVLSQTHSDGEHPIAFLRRKLHPAECRYSTIERETLAIKWAVEELQYYLSNIPFILMTDHAPLQWLHRVKDSNSCILRWYLALLPFSFQVFHLKGSGHTNADYSSRYPEEEANSGDGVCSSIPGSPGPGREAPTRPHHHLLTPDGTFSRTTGEGLVVMPRPLAAGITGFCQPSQYSVHMSSRPP